MKWDFLIIKVWVRQKQMVLIFLSNPYFNNEEIPLHINLNHSQLLKSITIHMKNNFMIQYRNSSNGTIIYLVRITSFPLISMILFFSIMILNCRNITTYGTNILHTRFQPVIIKYEKRILNKVTDILTHPPTHDLHFLDISCVSY